MARKNNRRAQAATAPVVEVETIDKPGMGIDEGIVLATFFLLAAAIACVVIAMQVYA